MDFIIRREFPQPNTLLIFANARFVGYNYPEINLENHFYVIRDPKRKLSENV